jgi:hypothetical protein
VYPASSHADNGTDEISAGTINRYILFCNIQFWGLLLAALIGLPILEFKLLGSERI